MGVLNPSFRAETFLYSRKSCKGKIPVPLPFHFLVLQVTIQLFAWRENTGQMCWIELI